MKFIVDDSLALTNTFAASSILTANCTVEFISGLVKTRIKHQFAGEFATLVPV